MNKAQFQAIKLHLRNGCPILTPKYILQPFGHNCFLVSRLDNYAVYVLYDTLEIVLDKWAEKDDSDGFVTVQADSELLGYFEGGEKVCNT